MPMRIEDYALLGDMETAALVGLDGSVDWLCLPRFDSDACFAALLHDEDAGHWRIAPAGEVVAVRRRYRDGSLVLETDFETPTGAVRVVDAMPPVDGVHDTGRHDLVRVVEGLRGTVEVETTLRIRFGYGRDMPWVRRVPGSRSGDTSGAADDGALVAIAGPDALALRGDVLPRAEEGRRHVARFTVSEGERVRFALVWFPSWTAVPEPFDVDAAVERTDASWREWSGRCDFEGPYRDAVVRSLITLKALTYRPTGGVVAAATTSLPETFGGERNWDYRYCWLRDATLTLWALLDAGYTQSAEAWRSWLLRAVAGDPAALQIMYGPAGERRLDEYTLPHLDGYEGSQPVRVGNAASTQFQLDVYGEVLNALYQARVAGIPEDAFSWPVQRAILAFLEDAWRRPDKGLWEVRGPDRHFTHSKVMCWVAFDRGVRAVEEHGLDGDADRWRRLRDEVREQVLREAWNDEVQAFTQYYGGRTLDAALLTMPMFGFLPADDPRMQATVDAIARELKSGDLVDRYTTSESDDATNVDGLRGREASFLACSFWYVDVLARSGREDEAVAMFERLLDLRNDVGLLAEEYDGPLQRQAGNMPQAFSHVALVGAAMTLAGHGAPPHDSPADAPAHRPHPR